MGIFDNLSFDTKIKILSDPKVKEAIGDGKISEKEAKLFKEYGNVEITDSDISDIENSYLELESYIENNKNAEKTGKTNETKNDANQDVDADVETPQVTTPTTADAQTTTTPTTKTQFKGSVEPAKVDGESSESLKAKLYDEEKKLGAIDNDIAAAKTTQTEAENEYLELLKKAAEEDEELKELENKRSDKEAEIAEQESAIAEIDTNITEKETAIKETETQVSDQKATVANVESQLSSLTAPPQTITETVTDKEGNTKTISKPNPEYSKYVEKKSELEKNLED